MSDLEALEMLDYLNSEAGVSTASDTRAVKAAHEDSSKIEKAYRKLSSLN